LGFLYSLTGGSMPDDKRYNGWANYATWGVALIIDNDQGLYSMRCEEVQRLYDETDEELSVEERRSEARNAVADWLKDWVSDELVGDLSENMMASQLMGAALCEVDWDEIAENWLTEVGEEEPGEE
jgi:hypothetical protein